jgi:predicted transcriptional regulator
MHTTANIQMIQPPLERGKLNRIPNEVVGATVRGMTPIQAWREHLGLTREVMAQRLGIPQSVYAKYEMSLKPRISTVSRIAAALGITKEQLHF